MNRKGVELAVNTLVTIILGTVVVVGGILLVRQITAKTEDTVSSVPNLIKEQMLNSLLNAKQNIVIYKNVLKVDAGESAVFYGAFRNNLEHPSAKFRFFNPRISVVPTPSHAQACLTNPGAPMCPRASMFGDVVDLPRFETSTFLIVVNVPKTAPSGEYSFEVRLQQVEPNNKLYEVTKIHIDVQ